MILWWIVKWISSSLWHSLISITEKKKLGDRLKIILNYLKDILKNVDNSMFDIHVIFFVLKYNPNIHNILSIFTFVIKENNKKRIKDNMKNFY